MMVTTFFSRSRLLIFAAFNDQGKVVDRLLDTGFALHNLDAMVALEIQRELDRPKLIKEDEPPAYWIAEHFSGFWPPDSSLHGGGHSGNRPRA